MKGALKKINLVYYVIYSLTILSAFGGYFFTTDNPVHVDPKDSLSISLSSILVLYILASIPGSLYLFHKKVKELSQIEDLMTKLEKYEKIATLRLIAIGTGLVASIIIFFILHSTSIIYCFGISAIALIFCKPSEAKLMNDLNLDEE